MRDRVIALAAAALVASAGASQAGLSLVEAGVVCPEIREATEQMAAPDTVSGFVDLIDEEVTFDVETRGVPLIRHLSFGMRVASDAPEVTDITVVIEHPPFGADATTRESWETTVPANGQALHLFSFDYEYEMVAGAWTFAVELDGERVVEVPFTIGVDPEPVDGVCVGMMSV